MLEYADFAQSHQDEETGAGGKLSNTILVRPLINMFVSEYKGADFRKHLNNLAAKKEYIGKVKLLIEDAITYYDEINPEALLTTSGERHYKPSKLLLQELVIKKDKFGELSEQD